MSAEDFIGRQLHIVHPSTSDPKRIRLNNYKAMGAAVKKALEHQPTLEEVLREKASARHPFRYTP